MVSRKERTIAYHYLKAELITLRLVYRLTNTEIAAILKSLMDALYIEIERESIHQTEPKKNEN